ncbi:sensor histidine kinase [Mucilaginibacter flavus]|uniref:sensor histidine kinase n=1 Tax=Mucilaginibacter flavus TaxID=931504 RepID=UPI0025B627A9|nr:HAMP domain-containing sensor histidine kinase [Mucilaginibacter flavus]MDN3582063.1 HAMP domain-containing sensor histidine kinase [Mucilaginibacter flavus]
MKLSDHYTRTSIYISLAVLFTGAVIYFFTINLIANRQLDRGLQQQLIEAEEYIRTNNQDPQQYDLDRDHAVFIPTHAPYFKKRFFDTVYFNPKEQKAESGRAVEDQTSFRGNRYKVRITISREGIKYLIEVITIITLVLLSALVLVLFFANRYLLNGLWKPFYGTLHEIKDFNIADTPSFNGQPSQVDEFTELNQAIHEMSLRVTNDYLSLKQFTENASHEMMTPLAVVTAKLDTLIQDETLGPDQLAQITDIYSSINKSTRLNQSLILLAKLENKLITDDGQINLDAYIIEKTLQFQELMQAKELTCDTRLKHKEINGSKYLIDILVNNLFSNAIRHNLHGGKIEIELSEKQLIFKNTGANVPLIEQQIFTRFQKGKDSQGMGLGLSLAKKICMHYHFTISYSYENLMHVFVIGLA